MYYYPMSMFLCLSQLQQPRCVVSASLDSVQPDDANATQIFLSFMSQLHHPLFFFLFFPSQLSLTQLSSGWCCFFPLPFWPLGGAPNYYPNSFSAPETQPQCVESKFKVSPDVARYNTDDEDNVTQVTTESQHHHVESFSR